MNYLMKAEVEKIVDAWLSGQYEIAIALTSKFQATQNIRCCLRCGKFLALQAKGDYCKQHRYLSQTKKAQVAKAKGKS